jgi:hypothetical protein
MEYHHPMDFIAEDCNAGLGISNMGKGIRVDGRCYLATEVPTTFFGPGLNWWKQRQKSWEMGRHGRMFAFLRQFLFCLPARKTPQGIIWHKITYLYLLCSIAIDWLRIPTFIALGRTATWWRNALLLMLFSAIPALWYNYITCRRRPDMKTRFWACITYPYYKQLYAVVAILGAVRAVGFYFGGHVRPPTIQQMLKTNDERCFWLDPRFETNPAWLADEGEALESKKKQSEEEQEYDHISDPFQNAMNQGLEPPLATYRSPFLGSIEDISVIHVEHSTSLAPSPSASTLNSPRLGPTSWSTASIPRSSLPPKPKPNFYRNSSGVSQLTLVGPPSPYLGDNGTQKPGYFPAYGEMEQRDIPPVPAIRVP